MTAWNRFLGFVARRKPVALALTAVALVASGLAASRITFSPSATEHLPIDEESVRFWVESSERFGAFDTLIVGLEEPGAALTPEGLRRLQRITGRLAELKSDGVVWVRSIANLDSMSEGEDGAINNHIFLSEVPDDEEGLAALARRIEADQQVPGTFVSRDQRAYALMLALDPKADAAAAARRIQQVVDEERGSLVAYYFGAPFFTASVGQQVGGRLPWLVPSMIALLLGVLALGIKRVSAMAIVLAGALASLVVWLGMLQWTGLGLTLGSVAVALIVLTLGLVAFSRGLEARLACAEPAPDSLLPSSTAAALMAGAVGAAAVWLVVPGVFSHIGASLALGCVAVLFVGCLLVAPSAACLEPIPAATDDEPLRLPRKYGLALAAAVLLLCAWPASGLQLRTTPQAMFGKEEPVGKALAFFDRRFGGPDFVQLHVRGDFRDPAVAARVMRLSDLLEGTGAFSSVQSVSQVLGYLGGGFAGIHRIPPSRESLGGLWFFLEGSPDVRNLVGDQRDEGMVMLRVPTQPKRPMRELVATIERAIAESEGTDSRSVAARLTALARRYSVALPERRLEALITEATKEPAGTLAENLSRDVHERLHRWLTSDESPYAPSDEEWSRLEPALASGETARARLITVARGLSDFDEATAVQLADTLLERQRDLLLARHSRRLAEKLAGEAVPEPFLARAQGVFADLLDPVASDQGRTTFRVSGLPVVTELVEARQVKRLWQALALLIGTMALVSLALERRPGRALGALLAAAMASGLTFAAGSLAGLDADPLSTALYLAPALLAVVSSSRTGREQWSLFALAAVGAAGACLLGSGALLVVRLGAVLTIGVVAVGAVAALATRVDGEDG